MSRIGRIQNRLTVETGLSRDFVIRHFETKVNPPSKIDLVTSTLSRFNLDRI